MESQNKATRILETQLQITQDEILQNKIEIADLFVKIHNRKPMHLIEPCEIPNMIEDMENISNLVKKLSISEAKMDALQKSKAEIEKCYGAVA